MHPFPTDFYGHRMSIVVLGYIRPELNYVSKGEPFWTLIEASSLLLQTANPSHFNCLGTRVSLTFVEALIDDINTDVKVALSSLARPQYAAFADDEFLLRA